MGGGGSWARRLSVEVGAAGCGLRSPRVCRAQRNVRGWRRRHTANSAWAGKRGVRQRGSCCCGALYATCTSASVRCRSRLQNTYMWRETASHLHSHHATSRHALHHPARDTPCRGFPRRRGQLPACCRHAAEHDTRWHTRSRRARSRGAVMTPAGGAGGLMLAIAAQGTTRQLS
jgi:hypothetical protein